MMANILLELGILVGVVMIFAFWASGSFFSYIFKLKINNTFVNIGIGFFVYFSSLSIILFPFEMISLLPYGYYLYITNIFSIIYIIITLSLLKFWMTKKIVSIDSIWFICIFIFAVILNYVFFNFLLTSNFSSLKSSLSVLHWLNDIQISFFGDILSGQLAFQNIQSWYTFQLSWVNLFNFSSTFSSLSPEIFQDYLFTINIIIEAALCASLISTIVNYLMKNNTSLSKSINIFITTILVMTLKFVLVQFEIDAFTSEMYYIYMILFVVILSINYVSSKYRSKNQPLLIGIIISSYIAFSWDLSYQMLFLLYSFIFVLQMWFKYRFTKDLYKISIIFILDFILYNVIEKLYLLSIIYLSISIVFSAILYLMNKSYNIAISFETMLNNNERISIMIAPIIIIGLSVFISLANDESIYQLSTIDGSTFSEIYKYFDADTQPWLSLTLTSILMFISFVWLFKTFTIKKNRRRTLFDLLFINYLTFYNPLSVRTLKYVVFNNMEFSSGIVLFIICFVIIIEYISTIESISYGKINIKNEKRSSYNNIKVLYR